MATKFKVGDKVVGNAQASKEYSITIEGWKGTVKRVCKNDTMIVEGPGLIGGTGVMTHCFDLVKPEKKSRAKTYSVDEEFILEGFKSANSEMKAKLKRKFPEVFKPKEIKFKDRFSTSAELSRSNEAFYLGYGHAPNGLENKCLILKEGVSVKVKKIGDQTILVFTKEIQ